MLGEPMSLARPLGITLFLLTAALTVCALVVRPRPASGTLPSEPWLAWVVPAGHQLDFIVPSNMRRLRLISRTALPEGWVEPPPEGLDYHIDVEWLDGNHESVLKKEFFERSGVSRLPVPGGRIWRSGWLPDDPLLLTDDRATWLPGNTVVPEGGFLRVTVPTEGATLFVRGFGEEDRGPLDAQLTLFGPTLRLQRDLLRRIGLPYWALLDQGERNALTRTVWRSLRVGSGSDEEVHARWILRSELRLTPEEQALTGTSLPPGRRVALNLVGPVSVRVSGGPEVVELAHSVVATQPGEVRATPDEPVEAGTDVAAIRYHLPPGPVSLQLANETQMPIGPFLFAVDDARPDQLYGGTAGARLEDLAPAGTGLRSEVVLVGPEWNNLTGYRVGGDGEAPLLYSGYWPEKGDVLQMLVRPVLADQADQAPRVVEVYALDDTGAELWRDSAAFTPMPAPYERLLESEAWLGEPEELYLAVNAGIRHLSVRSVNEVVVMMRVRGAPQGDPELYPLPEGEIRVRYPRRPVTTWRTVDPVNRAELRDQLVRVAANTRLEPRGLRRSPPCERGTGVAAANGPR
jgi:hypothetical protein